MSNVTTFPISGLKLIQLKSFGDDRGFFVERFREDKMREQGLPAFVQDNFSTSKPKVLRGLHYQFSQPQGKLVSCTRGTIFDVAVDLRRDSPTLGQHVSVVLSGAEPALFWIPAGFAHGFCVMGHEDADVSYKVDNYYNGPGEGSVLWNDSALKIQWPVSDPLLSGKDAEAPSFAEYLKNPKF